MSHRRNRGVLVCVTHTLPVQHRIIYNQVFRKARDAARADDDGSLACCCTADCRGCGMQAAAGREVAACDASRLLCMQVFEALWQLVVYARARARQRSALAGRFSRRMLVLRQLRAWRALVASRPPTGREDGGAMAELQHARTRSICPAAPHPERRPVVHQTPQPQPPPPPPQQQDAQYRYQPSGVQEHKKMGVKPGHRRARNPGPSPEILIARQEAERWFELQRWQQMLRCLRRWRARVAELCQRRHVREAKEFVRSQGRAQAAQKAKPSKPAHRRVDQRVFDQRATVRVPRHGPRRAPATSKAQKAREAEAELRQLRNGDISSLLSEGSSLWEASDYSGFGFARGRAIGRATCTSGRCNSGGRAASRYSDSNTGAENDPSAIWSDASSSDTPHSFATTDASDASNSTESIQTSAVESAWEEDFHARRG